MDQVKSKALEREIKQTKEMNKLVTKYMGMIKSGKGFDIADFSRDC